MPRFTSAFPREDYQEDQSPGQRGMTLRDYFAAKAMAAWITEGAIVRAMQIDPSKASAWAMEQVSAAAFQMADAMLAEREKIKP